MRVLSIDPGNEFSAYVLADDFKMLQFGKVRNEELMFRLSDLAYELVSIEMIASYGMAVGQTVFETCVWIGRYTQEVLNKKGFFPRLIYRKDIKMHLCNSMRAKDSNIRQALIDRFAKFDFKNGKGTKKNEDYFFGFKADMWQAFAVLVTTLDKMEV